MDIGIEWHFTFAKYQCLLANRVTASNTISIRTYAEIVKGRIGLVFSTFDRKSSNRGLNHGGNREFKK